MGFGMVLAQNKATMQRFEAMSEMEKRASPQRTHRVRSRKEMQQLVSSLTDHSMRT